MCGTECKCTDCSCDGKLDITKVISEVISEDVIESFDGTVYNMAVDLFESSDDVHLADVFAVITERVWDQIVEAQSSL